MPASRLITVNKPSCMKKHHELFLRLFKLLDNYKPQRPEFYLHLEEVIAGEYYPVDCILYEQDEIIKQLFFLASGIVIAYSFTDAGDKQLLHIYREGEIIAGQSFTRQKPSQYYLMVCKGAYMLHLTCGQLKEVYHQFPEAEELGRFRLSAMEAKELKFKKLLILPGIKMVEVFYQQYPELLQAGKVLRDSDIASYLFLAEGTLRRLRNTLLRNGTL
jgi:CRP-like cAMP-binding protein